MKAPALDKIFLAGDYEDKILHRLIIKYKYNFLKPLGKILARFLIIFWNFQSLNHNDFNFLIIPIPLSKKRLRWRGFNQAEIIAAEFSNYFGYELNLDLKREKHTPPQATLKENERLKNIKSAFTWRGENLNGRTVILIDDVITTGATLNEAALVLKMAGAHEVCALVLAKG